MAICMKKQFGTVLLLSYHPGTAKVQSQHQVSGMRVLFNFASLQIGGHTCTLDGCGHVLASFPGLPRFVFFGLRSV